MKILTIGSEQDLEGLKRIGRIVGLAIQEMSHQVKAGTTTAQLDAVGKAFLDRYGARPAPQLVYHLPGTVCISLNDEAAPMMITVLVR